MSAVHHINRKTIPKIQSQKGGTPLVVLTAYTAPMATMLDEYVDILLIGDSVGMVLYGMDTPLGVSVDMIINHTAAVVRGSKRACVIADLPFGSYETSPQQAFETAARILQETGAQGVKLEGGVEMAETVDFLTNRGIPVMGHTGLTPQSVNMLGGFKTQGRTEKEALQILQDSHAIADAGAFSIVLEGLLAPLADQITEEIAIPTIGIGASVNCDGQVLVSEDALGLFETFTPSFVQKFSVLAPEIRKAAEAYRDAVQTRHFPKPEHCRFPKAKA